MISIFVKELTNFLSSLIAYVVMGVFLTSMGLLMWVFSDTSVLDYGFADMDTLFSLGPYVFIFLVPAITMKSFAEERKMGTLELLLTKPLSDAQIIAGKFLAAVALVVFALIPSLIYYYSVYRLGNPPGNIDTAGVAGSYVGLLLLSMVFCAIGLFASSLTSNQIVSFILAAFISFIFYTGFESLSNLMSSGALVIKQLGILYHYESLSRGLIDSRSVIYFFSVAGLILLITNTVISSRQWINRGWKYSRKWRDLLLLANAAMAMLLINVMAARYFVRIDLTEERRYTIKEQTKHLLQNLDDDVFIEVFLEGDLNPAFGRFKKSIRETLEEFRIYSGNRVQYTFTDPTAASGSKARSEFMSELASKGITPRNIIENKDGQRVEKLVFPGALVSYGGLETGVMLLKGNAMQGAQQVLNQAIEGVEYELANAIDRLAADARPRVALIAGHGELSGASIESFSQALSERYAVDELLIENDQSLRNANLVIIAKPTTAFSEQDKYRLDQYLMRGGRILLLVDRLDAVMDSASSDSYFAFPYHLNLDDQLFRYGVRINPDLVQDRVAGRYPVVVSNAGRPQLMQMEWPFFPLINQYADHPITRNLDASLLKFVSSIDTVKATGVKKTPLLFSSPHSRKAVAPVKVGVNDLRNQLQNGNFQEGRVPVGYLLEGAFTSLYKNRFAPAGVNADGFMQVSKPAKIIVIADGDIIRNEVKGRTGEVLPLGFDPISQYTFANQDLLLNAVDYLLNENGLINARTKEVKIRPLDKEKIRTERTYWQLMNLLAPLMIILLAGVTHAYWRKMKYTRF